MAAAPMLFPAAASAHESDALCGGSAAVVGCDSLSADTLRRLDVVDSDLVRLRGGAEQGDVVLEVAGFGITLGRNRSRLSDEAAPRRGSLPAKRKRRFRLSMFDDIEFGFTALTGLDYSSYAPEQRGFLDQQLWPSFHFSFVPIQIHANLNPKGSRVFSVGLRYSLDNLRLSDNRITVVSEEGRIVPSTLESPAGKSKIVCSYLGIPLRLTWRRLGIFQVSGTIYNDFLLGADAIYKKPKRKHGLSGFRGYQFGLGASVAVRGVGFFVRYSFTPLFRDEEGPDCHACSFGISLALHR